MVIFIDAFNKGFLNNIAELTLPVFYFNWRFYIEYSKRDNIESNLINNNSISRGNLLILSEGKLQLRL